MFVKSITLYKECTVHSNESFTFNLDLPLYSFTGSKVFIFWWNEYTMIRWKKIIGDTTDIYIFLHCTFLVADLIWWTKTLRDLDENESLIIYAYLINTLYRGICAAFALTNTG